MKRLLVILFAAALPVAAQTATSSTATRGADNNFSVPQTAPAWKLDTSNKVLRSGSNTLSSADNGKSIYLTSSGSTQTLPTGLPFGFRVALYNTSAGDITLAIDPGVSVNGSSSSITIAPKTTLELTPTVDGGGGVVAFRAIASREPLSASTIWGRSSTGGAAEKTVTDFGFSLLTDADASAARSRLGAAPTSSPTFTGTATASTVVSDSYQSSASRVSSVTSSATIANSDNGKLINVTGTNAVILTVPSGLTSGMRFEVANNTTGSGSVTLATSSTTLNGFATSIVVPRIYKSVVEYTASNAYQASITCQRPGVSALRTVLPPADYTSGSGANQCWIGEVWSIPAQTNGLSSSNSFGALHIRGRYVINSGGTARQSSLQLTPVIPLSSLTGSIRASGSLCGDFVFNINAGVVDMLSVTNQNRLKLPGSGASSQKLRYKFSANFAANAGDVIVMSPSGHTFIVDDTITDATVWTSVSVGGVSVRAITGGSIPSTSDTSLTVNGGSSITTTYVSNTATNSGTYPTGLLFVSSTGVHVMSPIFGDFGYYEFIANL